MTATRVETAADFGEPAPTTVHGTSGPGKLRRRPAIGLPHRWCLASILAVNAVLGVWDLTRTGLQNTFYAAGAWSGSLSWHAFFFAGLDPAGGATIDKPPLALWVQGLSVRLFGLNSWGLLLPQVLMGVGCSGLLYLTVRRLSGVNAGLVAAAVMTLTPVGIWMFKSDNPDPLMVFLLVVAAYFLVRALDQGSPAWMAACGAAVGLAFEAKMLEAVLVVPGLVLAFLVAGGGGTRRRLGALLAAGGSMLVTGLWWMVVVQLTPPGRRPYISSTNTNSIFDLAFGYNGAERLATSAVSWRTSDRLFLWPMQGLISFLLPAALVAIPVLLLGPAWERGNRRRAAGLLFGGWLLVGGVTLTYSAGLINPYYSLVIAPPIAALVGIAGTRLWRYRRQPAAVVPLTLIVAASAIWGAEALHGNRPRWALLCLIAGAAALTVMVLVLRSADDGRHRALMTRIAGVGLVVAVLLPTAAAALAEAGTIHEPPILYARQPGLLATIADDPSGAAFAAAVVGGQPTADLEIQTRRAVLDIGGYHGSYDLPTLPVLEQMVQDHRIRYFLRPEAPPPRSSRAVGPRAPERISRTPSTVRREARRPNPGPTTLASQFTLWVAAHYRISYADGSDELYDLTRPAAAGLH